MPNTHLEATWETFGIDLSILFSLASAFDNPTLFTLAGGNAVPIDCREQGGGPAVGQTNDQGRGDPQLGTFSPRPRACGKGVPVRQVGRILGDEVNNRLRE